MLFLVKQRGILALTVLKVNDDQTGKSGSRKILCSDEGAFLQECFVCCKKKGRDQGANFPGVTAGDLFSVYKSGAPHGPSYLEIADRLGVLDTLRGC